MTAPIAHDITFGDDEPIVAAPGESVEFDFTVPEDGIEFLCSIPGHSDAGMTGVVHTPSSAASEGGASHQPAGGDEMAVEADPDAPPYELRDPSVPALAKARASHLFRAVPTVVAT